MKGLGAVVVLCLVLEAFHVSGLGEFLIAVWLFWPNSEPEPTSAAYQDYVSRLPGGKNYSAVMDRWEGLS